MDNPSSDNLSPDSPPPSDWPVSLEHLLNSSTGKHVFHEYLRNEDEGLTIPLLFLLAVEGLHEDAEEHHEDKNKTIESAKLICEKLLPSVGCVNEIIKDKIQHILHRATVNIFDEAVAQVKEYLRQHLYPNFLKSEFYLAAINQEPSPETSETAALPSNEPPCPIHPIPSSPNETSRRLLPEKLIQGSYQAQAQPLDLQTVHEEEVLSIKRPHKPFQLTEKILLSTQFERAKKAAGAWPPNPYYAQYSSYNPVSRQDSEIQSLSSSDSFCDSRRVRAPERLLNPDNLRHQPCPIQPHYSKYNRGQQERTLVKDDPAAFAKTLSELLVENVLRKSDAEKFRHHQHDPVNVVLGWVPPIGAGLNHGSGRRLFLLHAEEPEQEGQAILDQHVRRVWQDKTPELSCSPRNEPAVLDVRKSKRGHSYPQVPQLTTVLAKGKSVQTLDSGIGGDQSFPSQKPHRTRPLPPQLSSWMTEHFVDSGMSDAGDRSSTSDSQYLGRFNAPEKTSGRGWSGERPPRRQAPVPIPQQLPIPHRRHSPPSEDTVNVLVHYEFDREKPFLIRIPKNKLTLGVLKSKVPKKGNWKYLFKLEDADDKSKSINHELKRDEDILPTFRDCVIVTLKSIHQPLPVDTASNVV